jgi:hypothetical protein
MSFVRPGRRGKIRRLFSLKIASRYTFSKSSCMNEHLRINCLSMLSQLWLVLGLAVVVSSKNPHKTAISSSPNKPFTFLHAPHPRHHTRTGHPSARLPTPSQPISFIRHDPFIHHTPSGLERRQQDSTQPSRRLKLRSSRYSHGILARQQLSGHNSSS